MTPRQPPDLPVELGIALDANRVAPTLRLREIERGRDGEGGVGTETPPGDRRARLSGVSRQHRLQYIFPAICTLKVAGPQSAPHQIAELVEHEERMQALRLEVAIVSRSLLIAMNRALGAVHVQRDALRRSPVMHRVDPAAGQIGVEIDTNCQVIAISEHPEVDVRRKQDA